MSKLKATGQALIYSTYVGGSGTDVGLGIALDSLGKIYITGYTDSTDFPTKTPYQGALLGRTAAFVTKLDPKAASLQYSTYLGADGTPSAPESGVSTGIGIAVGPGDHVYVTGFTESPQFPLISAVQTYGGGRDDRKKHLLDRTTGGDEGIWRWSAGLKPRHYQSGMHGRLHQFLCTVVAGLQPRPGKQQGTENRFSPCLLLS